MSSGNSTAKNFFERLPVSYYDVDCDVAIANTSDLEVWEVTITFRRPRDLQIVFNLPCRHAIKGWLPWSKSPLQFIPEEMMRAPRVSSAWLLSKAMECGALRDLPELGLLKGCIESRT